MASDVCERESEVRGGYCHVCHFCDRSRDHVRLSVHCSCYVFYVVVGSARAMRCRGVCGVVVVVTVSGLRNDGTMEGDDDVVVRRWGVLCLACRCLCRVVCEIRHRHVGVLVAILIHEVADDRSGHFYPDRAHCAHVL